MSSHYMSSTDSLSQKDLVHPWWDEKTRTKALQSATRLFSYYADNDKHRLDGYRAWQALYTNRELSGQDYLRAYIANMKLGDLEYSRVPLNVIKICVDAVHARLTRPDIMVKFMSSGGNFSNRRKSKQMEHWVSYQEHACDLDDKDSAAHQHSLVLGTGIVKTCPHPKVDEIINACIHPRNVFVDEMEASTGDPTHMYQRQFVARTRLKAMYPRLAGKIDSAGRLSDHVHHEWGVKQTTSLGNLVEVVEGWHLPSWEGAGDGKHIILIDGQCLEFDDWEVMDFPFSFTQWKRDPTGGFWGIGLAEELVGSHFDMNTSIMHVEACVEASPKPYILIPDDGNISVGTLAGIPGIQINHTGRAPQIVLPPSVPADVVNYLMSQWQWALQISRLVAMGMSEKAGNAAETGQAFRDIVDIQNTELSDNYKIRQKFKVRLAEQQLISGKMVSDRAKSEGRVFRTVLKKDRNTIEEIDWDTFYMDPRKDSYIVQALPASALSVEFGGRLAQVKEMISVGMVDMGEALSLLGFPDLDHFRSLRNASRDAIERILEEILDEAKYTAPEPTTDLRLALKLTQMYINRAQAMGVPDDRINMLYQFLQQVNALLQEQQEATQMQAQGIQPGFAGGPPALDITGQAPAATEQQGMQQ